MFPTLALLSSIEHKTKSNGPKTTDFTVSVFFYLKTEQRPASETKTKGAGRPSTVCVTQAVKGMSYKYTQLHFVLIYVKSYTGFV